MHELKQFLGYLALLALVFVGSIAAGSFIIETGLEHLSFGAASSASAGATGLPPTNGYELSGEPAVRTSDDPPVWIAPTPKYKYETPKDLRGPMLLRNAANPHVAAQEKAKKRPISVPKPMVKEMRQEARKAFGSAEVPTPVYIPFATHPN